MLLDSGVEPVSCYQKVAGSKILNPKRPVIHTYIHTLMVVAALQGADQHIGSSILAKETLTCRLGESN